MRLAYKACKQAFEDERQHADTIAAVQGEDEATQQPSLDSDASRMNDDDDDDDDGDGDGEEDEDRSAAVPMMVVGVR